MGDSTSRSTERTSPQIAEGNALQRPSTLPDSSRHIRDATPTTSQLQQEFDDQIKPITNAQMTTSPLDAAFIRKIIDEYPLDPSQIQLLQDSDDNQRRCLLELWQTSPPVQQLRSQTNHSKRKSDRLPQRCRINSDKGLTYDARAPSKTKSKRKESWEAFYTRVYIYIKSRYNKLWWRKKRIRDLYGDDHDWTITISIIFEDQHGNEIMRHAKAKLDTGNPKNLISPAFAAKFGLMFESRNGEVILDTPGGGGFISVARIDGRWSCKVNDSHSRRRFRFDPKFMDATFEVSDTIERFDVVIGGNTIRDEGLLDLGPGLGLTGFRTKKAKFDIAQVQEAEEKQKQKQQENEEKKKKALEAQQVSRILEEAIARVDIPRQNLALPVKIAPLALRSNSCPRYETPWISSSPLSSYHAPFVASS